MREQEQAGIAYLDLDALERTALAATPGPWEHGQSSFNGIPYCWHVAKDGAVIASNVGAGPILDFSGKTSEYNAAFIAAANPSVVLKLIRRLRAAESAAPAQAHAARLVEELHKGGEL